MKKIIYLLIPFIILASCGEKFAHTIEGSISTLGLADNQTIFLYKLTENSFIPIDSSLIEKDGKFKITIKKPTEGMYHLGSSFVNTLPLLIEGNTKNIQLEINNNQQVVLNYKVKGSEKSEQMCSMYKKVYETIKSNKEIISQIKKLTSEDKEEIKRLQEKYEEISKEFLIYRNKFISENKGSAALIVVKEQINQQTEFDLLKEIAEDVNKTMPNTPYSSMFNNQIKQLEEQFAAKTALDKKNPIGSLVPELDFPSPNGKNVKLSSLKGKVVLLDFWASWCGPCRKKNPSLVKLYEKYKEKGFEIFSFSLDKNKEEWVKAINQDGLIWKNHVSDLKFWQTAAREKFGFNEIPFTILIDKEGKIVGKQLGEEKLEELIKQLL